MDNKIDYLKSDFPENSRIHIFLHFPKYYNKQSICGPPNLPKWQWQGIFMPTLRHCVYLSIETF